MIGIFLGGLGVGLPDNPILSGRNGIGGLLAGFIRTAVIGCFVWVFLGVWILGILWRNTTLLLVGNIVSVASKFL